MDQQNDTREQNNVTVIDKDNVVLPNKTTQEMALRLCGRGKALVVEKDDNGMIRSIKLTKSVDPDAETNKPCNTSVAISARKAVARNDEQWHEITLSQIITMIESCGGAISASQADTNVSYYRHAADEAETYKRLYLSLCRFLQIPVTHK